MIKDIPRASHPEFEKNKLRKDKILSLYPKVHNAN
jgi:hypothetical protein